MCELVKMAYWLYYWVASKQLLSTIINKIWRRPVVYQRAGTVTVVYSIGDMTYEMRTQHSLTFRPTDVIDDQGQSRLVEILRLLGPNLDWHGTVYRPRDFDCKWLTFHYWDISRKFNEDDTYGEFKNEDIL